MNTTELNGKKYQMQTQEDGNILLVEIKEPEPEPKRAHRCGDVRFSRSVEGLFTIRGADGQWASCAKESSFVTGIVLDFEAGRYYRLLCNVFDLAARFPEGFDVDDLCLKSEVRAALSHEDHWGDSLLGLLFSPDYLTNAWGRMFARNALRDLGIITDKD